MPTYEAAKLFSCAGLVAVITGGGSGLGSYTAKALDANGAKRVYIVGRRQESLDKVVAACPNGSVRAIVGDVTNKESLASVAAQIQSEVGYVNLLYANSGVSGTCAATKVKADATLAEWRDAHWAEPMEDFTQTFHTNVTGAFYTALAFLELLAAGNEKGAEFGAKSQIVVTSSIAGLSRFLATGLDYSTTKAAAIHLTKMLSTRFARWKIRANCIAPGFYPSEMTEPLPIFQGGNDPRKEGGLSYDACPLERSGTEEDFAGAVLYLMSPAGAYLNGNVIVTDGGRVSTLPAVY